MIKVKDIVFGEGMPKVCVPITSTDKAGAESEAVYISKELGGAVDLVELRIDYLEEVRDAGRLQEVLRSVGAILGEIPLLCTLRSSAEGGELPVTEAEYEEILENCLASKAIDFLDVEYFKGLEVFERIVAKAHEQQIFVIASNHDFSKTPEKEQIVKRLKSMEIAGADIAKIAVMPNSEEDVLVLLEATTTARRELEIPVCTISMGKTGLVTRLAGGTFGSCITFGVGKKASAPGQIDAKKLKEILEIMS